MPHSLNVISDRKNRTTPSVVGAETSSKESAEHDVSDEDQPSSNSFQFDNMPSSSERMRRQSAEALSKSFVKAWSGICCRDSCRCNHDKDPLSVDEKKLRNEIQASSSPSDVADVAESPPLLSSSLTFPGRTKSSISPLVMTAMDGDTLREGLDSIEALIEEYLCLCRFYQVPYNAGILTTIRFSMPSLRPTPPFHDLDMLALVEMLLRHANGQLSYVCRLDFSRAIHGRSITTRRAGFTSHGALALAKALQSTKFIQQVWISRNVIGPYGASAIFLACHDNPSVHQLDMRRCRIGERGALAFCELLLNREHHPEGTGLIDVDLSTNGIGHAGTVAIERALEEWNVKSSSAPMFINLEGNLVFPEIMNAVTHGLGVILSIIGGYVMSERVKEQSIAHKISCSIYTTSLLTLYLSSTLYHSFFPLQHIKYIFQVMDKCAIYVLIAGSYTPILTVIFHDNMVFSFGLLGFIWTCCLLGISVEAFAPTWNWRPIFSLAMYLGMGWAALVVLPDAGKRLPVRCIHLLVLGGFGYTLGVPFFVRDNNLDHALWHLFVLSGSVFHWLAIYLFVANAPLA